MVHQVSLHVHWSLALTFSVSRTISKESLVIGALESAFWDTDQQIGEEKKIYHKPGGCTVIMAVFILGKLYVANAGDSRGMYVETMIG